MEFSRAVLTLSLVFVTLAAQALDKRKLEHLRSEVRELQLYTVSYSANADSVYAKANRLMPELKRNKCYILYFAVWDMYVQAIYYNDNDLKAQNELRKMFQELRGIKNPEAEVHAYVVQGMLQQRFGEYQEAKKTLRKGLSICPPLDQCKYPRNLLSLYRWLLQSYIYDKSNYAEALHLCDEQDLVYKRLMNLNRGDELQRDKVMILSQRASVLVGANHIVEAKRLLDTCHKMMVKNVSPMLYMHYYEALVNYFDMTAEYDKALDVCNMLAVHFSRSYRPMQRQYLRKQAELLIKSGRKSEAAEVYCHYVAFDDSLNRVRVTNDLKELELQYNVYHLNIENNRWHSYMLMLTLAIFFLLVIIGVFIWSYVKTKRKNRILVERLNDVNIFSVPNEQSEQNEDNIYLNISRKFQVYLNDDIHLQNSDLTTAKIAADLNIAPNDMSKALKCTTGLGPNEYLNKCRLEKARHILMKNMEASVQQVAYSCGYKTVRTFQRQFNLAYGMSPSVYRHTSHENR